MQTPIDAADNTAAADLPGGGTPQTTAWRQIRQGLRSWPVMLALAVLVIIVAIALFAPWLGTVDPVQINPGSRLKQPFTEFSSAPTPSAATSGLAWPTARASR